MLALALTLVFGQGLIALFAFGLRGVHFGQSFLARILFGGGAPLLVAVFWGVFLAPKASVKFPPRLAEARAYATRLRQDFSHARIFLYGSVSRGDFNLHSDVDLLVVADLPEHPLARAEALYRSLRSGPRRT